jgi:hypothetical protein
VPVGEITWIINRMTSWSEFLFGSNTERVWRFNKFEELFAKYRGEAEMAGFKCRSVGLIYYFGQE